MAQQAYRNREKATIATLRTDVDDLRSRLTGMERISDQLFELVSSFNPQDGLRRAIQSLREDQDSYRLPSQLPKTTAGQKRKAKAEHKDVSQDSLPNKAVNIAEESNLVDLNSRFLTVGDSFRSMSFIDELPVLTFSPSIPTPHRDSVLDAESITDSPLAFSTRLRHEAIRGAYDLITLPQAPYPLLCKKFRYCIFSSTRTEIMNHLDVLLYQSAKTRGSPDAMTIASSFEPDKQLAFPTWSAPGQLYTSENGEEYIHAEAVSNYLLSMGLIMNPGSAYAEFSGPLESLAGSKTTIFDEVRQKEQIRLNTTRLFRGE